MAVIGFLTYTDFLNELNNTMLLGRPIRVQQSFTAKQDSQYGILQHYTFTVEAAIEIDTTANSPDTLICRFVTGRASVMGDHDHGKITHLNLRNKRAADILEQVLRNEGFITAPGLIAAAAESKTEADPGDLWTAADLSSPPEGRNEGDETEEPL